MSPEHPLCSHGCLTQVSGTEMLRPGPRPRGGSPRGLRPCSDRDPPGFCVKNAVFPRAEPACGPLRPAAPRAAPALCGRPPCHLRAFATPALPAAPLGCPSVTATTLPPFIDSATTRTISSDKTKNAHVCAQNATLTPMLLSFSVNKFNEVFPKSRMREMASKWVLNS